MKAQITLFFLLFMSVAWCPAEPWVGIEYQSPYVKLRAPNGLCNYLILLLHENITPEVRASLAVQGYAYDLDNTKKALEQRGTGDFTQNPYIIIKYDDAGGRPNGGYRIALLRKNGTSKTGEVVPMDEFCSIYPGKASYCNDIVIQGKKIGFDPLLLKSSQKLTTAEKALIAVGAIAAAGILAAGVTGIALSTRRGSSLTPLEEGKEFPDYNPKIEHSSY